MKNILIIIVFLFIASCDNIGEKAGIAHLEAESAKVYDNNGSVPATMQSKVMSAPNQNKQELTPDKKVVKTGGIRFESENIQSDYKQIVKLLSKYGAYIENENQSKTTYQIDYSVTIRVPAATYDTLFSSIISATDKIDSKYSNVEDVTERYYDLKSRIKNKKALEARYIELLKKANDIKDLLEVERNINIVRTDIENLQGTFNYLSKKVSLSTIQLDFHQNLPYVYQSTNKKGFGDKMLSAFDSGWQGFLYFLIGITTLWPFIVLLVGIIYLFKFLKKRWKNKNNK